MPEIDRQLEKLPNFEDNLKTLVIPALNFYLNYNQYDVHINSFRPRKRQGENSAQSPTNSTIKTEETLYSSTSLKWLTMTITKIIVSSQCSFSAV